MLSNLIFNLLIVHILCDFYFQTPSMCVNKIRHTIKGCALWSHVAVVGLLSWIAVWSIYGWWLAILIMVSHLAIDWLKSLLQLKEDIYRIDRDGTLVSGSKRRYDLYLFIGDQILHILMIGLIAWWWYRLNNNWEQFQWLQFLLRNHTLLIYSIVALLLVLKPVNILMLQILRSFKLDDYCNEEEHGYFHAGALIGYTERSLMLLFVILSQYEAIGFLIAAKSILRFNEASSGNVKSEYVLSGTLLSLIFSLLLGLCAVKLSTLYLL